MIENWIVDARSGRWRARCSISSPAPANGRALIDEATTSSSPAPSDRQGGDAPRRRDPDPVSLELGGKDPMIVSPTPTSSAPQRRDWGGLQRGPDVHVASSGSTSRSRSTTSSSPGSPSRSRAMRRAPTAASRLRRRRDHLPPQIEIVIRARRGRGARAPRSYRRPSREVAGRLYISRRSSPTSTTRWVMREETFGPVIPVMRVPRRRGGDPPGQRRAYGLPARSSPATSRAAEAIARRIEAGSIGQRLGGQLLRARAVPMGGWKNSGLGYRHGADGIQKFVRSSSIVSRRGRSPRTS